MQVKEKQYRFSEKTISNQRYLYLQHSYYDKKTRKAKTESVLLGNTKNIHKILTLMFVNSESLFIGEYLLYKFAEHIQLMSEIMKLLQSNKFSPKLKNYFFFLVNMRVIRPFSKDALTRYFSHSYFRQLSELPHVNEFYEAMDLFDSQEAKFIKLSQSTHKKLHYSLENVYYDTSTIHFFSQFDDLRRKGFGKTGPRGSPLIKVGLACTEDYLPLAYSVYPGNESDIFCFEKFLESDWQHIRREKSVLFFDAGCYSKDLISKLDEKNTLFVASVDITKYKELSSLVSVQINEQTWEIQEALYEEHRVITGYNKDHHAKAKEKINKNIKKVEDFLQQVKGKDNSSKHKKITSLINSLKLKNILILYEDGNDLKIEINTEKLKKKEKQAKRLVIMTNLIDEPKIIIEKYLGRGEVERVYHYLKTPLETQPVYHSNNFRIRSHIFIIMMGFLHLTAFRLYLRQNYNLCFTIDQLLEELRFCSCLTIEPKKGLIMTYAGKQPSWIHQLINDWKLPLINESDMFNI